MDRGPITSPPFYRLLPQFNSDEFTLAKELSTHRSHEGIPRMSRKYEMLEKLARIIRGGHYVYKSFI